MSEISEPNDLLTQFEASYNYPIPADIKPSIKRLDEFDIDPTMKSRFRQKEAGHQRYLNTSASGGVVMAKDKETGEQVVLKHAWIDILENHPSKAQGLINEAVLLSKLNHPNIPRLKGLVLEKIQKDGGEIISPIVAMEQADGVPLIRLDCKPQTLIEIGQQVASALDYMHGQGLVHKDVKLENIIVDPKTGRAVLIDYDRTFGEVETQTGTLVLDTPQYSPGYEAPELKEYSDQYYQEGKSDEAMRSLVGPKVDQYALATVMEKKLVQYPHLLIPMYPDAGNVIAKAKSEKPEDRYDTCTDFMNALQDSLQRKQTR